MDPVSPLFAILFLGFLVYWFLIHPKVKAMRAEGRGLFDSKGARLSASPKMLTEEQRLVEQADLLLDEAKVAVNRSTLSNDRKRELLTQAAQVPANVRKGAERLEQLARLRELAGESASAQVIAETRALERRVRADMGHSIDLLLQMPLTLTRIEVERANVDLDRVMEDLSETNARLNDTAEAARELRAHN